MFCQKCGKQLVEESRFCGYCGEPTAHNGMRGTTSGVSRESGQRGDADGAMQQIVNSKIDYYLPQFGQLRQGGKSKINWASFFFGVMHACYRNVWREWLKAMCLPLSITVGSLLIGGLILLVQPIIGMTLAILGLSASVWTIIAHIMFARRFNQIYLHHVETKIAQNNMQPDPSRMRVLGGWIIAIGIQGIISGILIAIILAGMANLFSSVDDADFAPYYGMVESGDSYLDDWDLESAYFD